MQRYYTDIKVIYADTDAMGIVYHGNYAKWFEVGRTEYLRELGFPYSVIEKEGLWLPVRSLTCNYKSPAVYDDVLKIATWVGKLGGASIEMQYEIFRKETDELLVTGMTKHAVTDENLKPIKLKKVFPDIHAKIVETME